MNKLAETELHVATDISQKAEFTANRAAYWNEYADQLEKWTPYRRYYRWRIQELYQLLIPPGMRVLELGCGEGDLVAHLQPSYGVGVDFSEPMIERARKKYPEIDFVLADAHDFESPDLFDFIILSDLVNDLWDVQRVFEVAARHAHPGTRIIANFYSHLWEIPRVCAEWMQVAKPQLLQSWQVRIRSSGWSSSSMRATT